MHTAREKTKLLARVRRIRGQVEAIERALDAESGCAEVLHLVAAVRGATNGLMAELIEDHIREHIVGEAHSKLERDAAAHELVDVVRAYMK